MLSRTKVFAGLTAVVAAVSAGVPAAGAAPSPCQAVSQSTGSEVQVVVEGHYSYTRGNAEVTLTCKLIQNGVTLKSVSDPMWGPVAALAFDERIGTQPFSVCYWLLIKEAGPEGFPTNHYHYTNC